MKPYARNVPQIIKTAIDDGSIERWARAGATEVQIASNLGVSYRAWCTEKSKNQQLVQVITRARKPIVIEAFEGLIRLSTGFEHAEKTSTTKEVIFNGQITTLHEDKVEIKYYPPQPNACVKVIINYLNMMKKAGKILVPDEYLSEAVPPQQQAKDGRLTEMDEAMRQLFFGVKNVED